MRDRLFVNGVYCPDAMDNAYILKRWYEENHLGMKIHYSDMLIQRGYEWVEHAYAWLPRG